MNLFKATRILPTILALCLPNLLQADPPSSAVKETPAYKIEAVPLPEESPLEVGGMCWMPDGRLMVCTRRGDVWSLKDGKWKRFATGLHEALGIISDEKNGVFVTQRPELTHLLDTKNTGEADVYETFSDKWGFSGNYHEFAFGLVRDKEGNLCGTLNLAHAPDSLGGVFMGTGPKTPYRGWVFKVTPKGEFIPFANGLRSPNGIGIDPQGEIFFTDNQGEFEAADMLHHVKKDAFYGHPSSLIFEKSWNNRDPKTVTIDELNKRRQRPVIIFPYGVMGQSISAPVWDTTAGKFGPFAGQMFVGDVQIPIVMRCTMEKIDGELQGACYPFLKDRALQGTNRLLFAPDGSLYVGCTDRGWVGGAYGLQHITFTGQVPLEIQNMSLTDKGFDLTFTKPVDAAAASSPESYPLYCFHYEYHRAYGSPEFDRAPVKINKVVLSPDRLHASLILPELLRERIYVLNLKDIKDDEGHPTKNPTAYYTLNRFRNGNPATTQPVSDDTK